MVASRMPQCGADRDAVCVAMFPERRGLGMHQPGMHQRLFGPHILGLAPVPDPDLGRVLRHVAGAAELRPFRIWLVGSRLEVGKSGSDVDVVLSPRPGTSPSEHLIEQALWYCREYGLYRAGTPCVIDPCFRSSGPTVALAPLRPHIKIVTTKLFSPRLAELVRRGRLREWRRVGESCIEFARWSEDTDYFPKLPRRNFDGACFPYLRPALEIVPAGDPNLSQAIQLIA